MVQPLPPLWGVDPAVWRMGIYLTLLLVLMGAEAAWPRRARSRSRLQRWPSNLTIAGINALLVRLATPVGALVASSIAESRSWGILHHWILPSAVSIAFTVVAFDLLIYWQHRWFHSIPVLWRLHRMHHTDIDLDVTSGSRFHSLEILASLALKSGAVLVLGAPAFGVFTFEVLLSATALFNHSNLRLSSALDRVVRCFIVTPDMHRVHHSSRQVETDSNFGFNLPWWDWCFGTYRCEPALGHDRMEIGLETFREEEDSRLPQLLSQPFRK